MAAAPLLILHQAILGSLGLWVSHPPPSTPSIPTEKRARTRAHQSPHSIALSPDSTLRAFFPFRYSTSSIITTTIIILNPPNTAAASTPTRPRRPQSRPSLHVPTLSAAGRPLFQPTENRDISNPPLLKLSSSPPTARPAFQVLLRTLPLSWHSIHTTVNRCGSFDSS